MWDCPVSKRAWCFKSASLRKLTVHFCEEQLYWHCNKVAAPERGSWDSEFQKKNLICSHFSRCIEEIKDHVRVGYIKL
jgi:hypothetical protein